MKLTVKVSCETCLGRDFCIVREVVEYLIGSQVGVVRLMVLRDVFIILLIDLGLQI